MLKYSKVYSLTPRALVSMSCAPISHTFVISCPSFKQIFVFVTFTNHESRARGCTIRDITRAILYPFNVSSVRHIYSKHVFFYQSFPNMTDKVVTIATDTSKRSRISRKCISDIRDFRERERESGHFHILCKILQDFTYLRIVYV